MSIARRIKDDSHTRGMSRFVLILLADHADAGGMAAPSVPQLAAESALSDRQVQRILCDLVAAGEIAVVQAGTGRGRGTVYGFPRYGRESLSSADSVEKGDIKGDISSERLNDAEKGDIIASPFSGDEADKKGDISEKGDINGDTVMSPFLPVVAPSPPSPLPPYPPDPLSRLCLRKRD